MLQTKSFLDNYIIYSDGRVYNTRLNRFQAIEKTKITNKKKKHYCRVSIKRKHYQLHRLVAEAFIPNPENKPCINHIDGNTENNDVSNLEWVTYSENELHSYRTLGKKPIPNMKGRFGKNNPTSIPIVAKHCETGNLLFFNASKDAERQGFNQGLISECLRRKRIKHKGYFWFYKKDFDKNPNIAAREKKQKGHSIMATTDNGNSHIFKSVADACRFFNIKGKNIWRAIKENGKAYNIKWQFVKDQGFYSLQEADEWAQLKWNGNQDMWQTVEVTNDKGEVIGFKFIDDSENSEYDIYPLWYKADYSKAK